MAAADHVAATDGPLLPMTPDKRREAEHTPLRKAFPNVDVDGTGPQS